MAAVCSCGRQNPHGAKFCLECGSPLARACAVCTTPLPADAKFCLECGHPVGTPVETVRRETRKVVSIVFVDLAGSTSLQERMDPESVRRVMERFYATMRSEIEAAGGLVVKFTGDGVMAGFGIREAAEDDALRAVRAAVAMQKSFGEFADEIKRSRGADVSLRVGINTGEVVVSDEDDDVIGDVVNVAARLEHAAGDGNVLVGDETWKLTRHAVTFEAVAPLDLKGKAEPVAAYRVVSLEAPHDSEAAAVPFVGRTAELRRLRAIFDDSVASSSPAVITIVGSPGLGKTRIAWEFASSVADRVRVLAARCDAAGTATYAPIAEAFRDAAGIPETAAADEVVSALDSLLPDGFPDRSRVASLVASLLGVGDPAPPQETFWSVRRLLEGLAATQPVVLVIDDVQWAEPLVLDLLDHVVEWAKDAPIVIVALARPEIRDIRPSLLDAGSIVLEGLDPGDTAELALSLLGAHDLPPQLVRRVLATTEGNPLFVRELLRMLVDDGVLSREGERWVVTVEADEIDVPPTIHALLSARIERLRDDERAVVERASVVGHEFYRGAVVELVPPTVRPGIDAHLETLRRKELVEPEGTYWIDERVFRFHHVLIRDAAYRRLLKEARAELHERFADWLEAKVGELVGEHDEVLGYHLEQAHTYLAELGTADAHHKELGRRASIHLASAARRALDRDDLRAAANLSGRALALTEDDSARARILRDRCEALLAMGDVDAAGVAVSELRSLASDERLTGWADCYAGQLAILVDPSRLRDTADAVEDAARRLSELGDTAGAAKAHAVHAQALAHLGQFGACESALDRALAAAREAGDKRRANAVLSSAPFAALWGPSPVPRASGRCLDVVRVLRITAGAPAVEATALRCQAVLEAMRGRADAAHRMLASARSTLEELGLRHALVECDLFAGLIDLFSSDAPSAEAHLRRAHEGFRALNVGADIAQAAALLARTLVEQGRDDEALELTEESERLGGDDLKTAIAWRCVRARVLARRREVDAAIDVARAAVDIAQATDALIDHAEARLALAEVLKAAGRDQEAAGEADVARELYARKEAAVDASGAAESQIDATTGQRASPSPVRSHEVHAAPGVAGDDILAVVARWRSASVALDRHAMAEVLAPDFVYVDHRSGLRSELRGGAAWADALQSMWQDQQVSWEYELLTVWAPGLALVRVRSSGSGWERSYLLAGALREGVIWRTEVFDENDYESAFARLDELAFEWSPARDAIAGYVAAPNEHGWTDAIGIAASGGAALVRANGSFAVVSTSDGAITAIDLCDDELTARKRLNELAPSPSYVSWATLQYFDRHTHQDWDALRDLIDSDVEFVDQRPLGWGTVRGLDELLQFVAEGARRGSMTPGGMWITEWLAITSDKALYRYRWPGTSADGAEFVLDRVMLSQIRNGVSVRVDLFDPDQLDEACRMMAGEPPAVVHQVVTAVQRIAALGRLGDWDAVADAISHDVVYEDHRPLLRTSSGGRDVVVEAVRYQLRDGGSLAIELIDDRGPGLALVRVLKRLGAAGDSEIPLLIIYGLDDDGRLSHCSLHEENDLAGARARLDAIAGRRVPSVHTPPDGSFTEFGKKWEKAFEAGAGEGLEALYPPDFQVIEHTTHVTLDRETHLDSMRRVAEQPNAMARVESIMCLGARHGVNRTIFSWDQVDDAGPVEASGVSAVRMDAHGRCSLFEWFPANQLHRALARAEELYLEDEATGEAAAGARRRLTLWRTVDSHNAGDWEALAQAFAPDIETVDHRALGWATLEGRETVINAFRAVYARSTSHVWSISAVHAIADDGCVYTLPTEGTDRDGGRYEQGGVVVALFTDTGATRMEIFPFDAVDSALRRFEELRPGAQTASATLERLWDRWYAAVEQRDMSAAADLFSRAYRAHEHSYHLELDRETQLENLERIVGGRGGFRRGRTYVLGDRHGVARMTWTGTGDVIGDSEATQWYATRCDSDGRFVVSEIFPDHRLLDALARAEELFLEDEATGDGAEASRRRSRFWRYCLAYNAGDWAALEAALAPEFVTVDHRPAGWGRLDGRDAWLDTMRGLAGLAQERRWLLRSVDFEGATIRFEIDVTGSDEYGGPFVMPFVGVIVIGHHGLLRQDFYSPEQRAHAEDRFRELADTESRLAGPGAATELARALATHAAGGRDATAGQVLEAVDWTHSIWLGDRHGVVAQPASPTTSGNGGGVSAWYAARCRGGRITDLEVYPPDKLLAAMARAEELYLEDEATGQQAEWSRHRLRLWRAFVADNEGDWETWWSLVDPDAVVVDRSPLGWGEVDTAGVRQRQEALQDLTGRAEITLRSVAIDGEVVLVEIAGRGTNEAGGRFEIDKWLIQVGTKYQEHFALEQRDEAAARFRELAEDARRGAA